MAHAAVELVVTAIEERRARLVAVTGGVAAGKSTLAEAVVAALPRRAVTVSTDGFLVSGHPRKGFPESYDAAALDAFLARVAAGDEAAAVPVYSHLAYDVVPGAFVRVGDAEVVVVDGLHLGSPELGVRERFDLVVHLDADEVHLERWYLERFRSLREQAAGDPTAFLSPYLGLGAEALDAMALDVWRAVNLVVLHDHVRPCERLADVVLRLGADHALVRAEFAPH